MIGTIGSFLRKTLDVIVENASLSLALTASGGAATAVVAYQVLIKHEQVQESSSQNTALIDSPLAVTAKADKILSKAEKQFNNIPAGIRVADSRTSQTVPQGQPAATMALYEGDNSQVTERSAATMPTNRQPASRRLGSTQDKSTAKNKATSSSTSKSPSVSTTPEQVNGGGSASITDSATNVENDSSSGLKITLTSFMSGESFKGQSSQTISWFASGNNLKTIPIDLEYSTDNGTTWIAIANVANTGVYSWSLPAISSTTCLLRASVSDQKGNVKKTLSSAFSVDSLAPSVSLSNPIGGENVRGGSTMAINWLMVEALPATNPIEVQYTIDGGAVWTSLGTFAETGPINWTVPNVDSTDVQIRVLATDLAGNLGEATSPVFSIDSTVPTVSTVAVNVATGSYKLGQSINVTVQFSENVVITGTPQLTLNTTATNRVLNLTSSATNTLTFVYTVQAGESATALDALSSTALSLNGGTIKDTAENLATLTLPVPGAAGSISQSKTIQIDSTLPARPNIYLTSPDQAQATAVTLTAANCTDTAFLYITEDVGETPIGNEASWQACSLTASAITYTLSSTTVGARPLYVWAKDAAGNVSATAKTIPLKYVPKLILGQTDETQSPGLIGGQYNPAMIKYINGKIYIPQQLSPRVLVYNSIPTSSIQMPDAVLGQKVGFKIAYAGITANRFGTAVNDVESDGTHFAVVDGSNNRVLLWNTIPTNGDTPADLVLGQDTFYTGAINGGLGATTNLLTCASLNGPRNVIIDGNKLIVSDYGNHRILIWNTWPTSNNQPADVVLGQTSCSTNAASTTATGLYGPLGIKTINGKLIVVEVSNNRVLIWNSIPTVSGTAGNLVLGQATFTTNNANSGGISASSLKYPRLVESNGSNLIIADSQNNRILIWNTFPTVNNQAADVVLGQPNFTSATVNQGGINTATSLNVPQGVQIINGDLWVVDTNNNRILKYSGIPTVSGTAASFVLGQDHMDANFNSFSKGVDGLNFNRPIYSEIIGNRLFVTNFIQNRILIYNSWPANSSTQPDLVLGQTDFISEYANRGLPSPTASTLSSPGATLSVAGKFFIADSSNSRILGYNSVPTTSTASADFVLGQPNFNVNTLNNGGRSAATLYSPRQMSSDGQKFAVADYGNHRILIWNSIPNSNAQPADVVVGQPDMSSGTANNGGISAATLNVPNGVVLAENKLIVADQTNNRLLIWDPIPTANGTPATYVIGQPDFVTNTGYNTSLNQSLRITPTYVSYKNGKLFSSNAMSYVVNIWDQIPNQNNQEPDRIFGVSSAPYNAQEFPPALLSENLLNTTWGIFSDGSRMLISEYGQNRLNVVPIPEVSLTSSNNSSSTATQITVHDCNNRSAVFFNESTVPAANANGWQTCVTTRNAMTYTVSNGEGLKNIKVWFKDSDGNVLPNPHKVSRWLVTTNNAFISGTLAVTSPTSTATVVFTPISASGQNGNQVRLIFTENATPPALGDAGWQDINTTIPYTLVDQTDGLKNLYLWGVDVAGNITAHPTIYKFIYDKTPPTVPSATLSGFYAATYKTVARITMSSCTDTSKVFVNESTAPAASASGWVTCNTNTHGITYTFPGLTEGNHALNVWAQDSSGNVSVAPYVVNANFNSQLALGQNNVSSIATAATNGFTVPRSIHSDGTHFIVADNAAGRVLIYNGDPRSNNPAVVLGASSLTEVGFWTTGAATASSISTPIDAIFVGSKVVVSDYYNNRVLIWNSIPTVNNQAADVVLGQPNFTSNVANAGGRSCATLNTPRGLASDGTRLLVADYTNNRVLIWNTIPTVNGTAADVVIGESSCSAALTGSTSVLLKTPIHASIDGNQIFISDYGNHRVLIYNSIPTTHGASADIVLGQSNFTANTANQGVAVSASTLKNPLRVISSGGKLYVSDAGNSRVLIYTPVPTSNNAAASIVLGQTTMSGAGGATSQVGMGGPEGLWLDAGGLFVVDNTYHRIKHYTLPLSTGQLADAVIGQPSWTSGIMNSKSTMTTSATDLFQPINGIVVGTKFILPDNINHRVLIWNSLPTVNNQSPDVVIGQPNKTSMTISNPAVPAAGRLYSPYAVASDGTRLIIADYGNYRVLIFNTIPTADGASADLVLGQASLSTFAGINRGGAVAANTMYAPSGLYTDGTRLYVADYANNRVLGWSTFPTVDGQAADFVLGQANFTTNTLNRGTTVAANSLYGPRSILEANGKLFITDTNNSRVLIWNTIPNSTGVAADVAIGQPNLTSNGGAAGASVFSAPWATNYINGKLYINDGSNRRIMIYNSIPTTSGVAADSILGQASSGANNINSFGISAWSIGEGSTSLFFDGTYFWVTDRNNHRVVKLQLPP